MRAARAILVTIGIATAGASLDGALLDDALLDDAASARNGRVLSFRYDVLPILARQGCASAYCHGAATGQGGFVLSLFGSDPRADYLAITEEFEGRRLDLLDPDQSLLLKKPSRRVRHKGGRKLPRDSEAYALVRTWIEQGAAWAVEPGLELEGLQIARDEMHLRAIAGFRAGDAVRERDVTHLAQWSTSDERIATVSSSGEVTLRSSGKAFLFARFGNQDARMTVVQPFDRAAATAPAAAATEIDRTWLTGIRELGLSPAPRAAEHQVMRRVYLDLVGRPPTPSEIDAYQALALSERAREVATELAASSEFAEVWGGHIANWLEIPDPSSVDRGNRGRVDAARQRRQQIRRLLVEGRSLPEIVQHLLRRRAIVYTAPDPRDRVEVYGRTLLGVRLGCARCHDHPHDRWQRADHLGFAAHFADPRPAGDAMGKMSPGLLFDPGTGEPIAPRMLGGARGEVPVDASLAERVEWFALDGGSHLTHRNFANRVFASLFGRGLVEATNDHRLSNPAVHEALLELLARQLEEDGGDLRVFVVRLVTSQMYAMSSEPVDGDADRDRARRHYFARRTARALSPRAFRRAALRALGHEVAEAAVPASPLARQLAVLNGDDLSGALERGGHLVDAIADFGGEPRDQLRDLWVLILSREPTAAETDVFLSRVRDRQALRELAFALLASREFGSVR